MLRAAMMSVPAGRWAVAVSGGADSVATLRLLSRRKAELHLVVVHIDHELRGEASREDARFVEQLAEELGLVIQVRTRTELEQDQPPGQEHDLGGKAAYLRRLRMEAYRQAVDRFELSGVILAHHADDVAETLFMRLIRGSPRSGTLGLAPLRFEQSVAGVRLLRPMLGVRRNRLRRYLERTRATWREDASNESQEYLRNQVRKVLACRPAATETLLGLARWAARAEAELDTITPVLSESPRLSDIIALAEPIRRRALRRWMVLRGVAEADAGPAAVDAVLALTDAAGPPAVDLGGGLRARRKRGHLVLSRTP